MPYFAEVSYNQLRYTGDVAGIAGATPVTNSPTVAYVRLPNPVTYYRGGPYPKTMAGAVSDTIKLLDEAGFDFSPYANPVTNEVENLVVILAGSSVRYTDDWSTSFMPTSSYLLGLAGAVYTSTAGQVLDNFTICVDQKDNQSGELDRIGVCAHEHGHSMGMGDLYDLSGQTAGDGYYDTMAGGIYGGQDGMLPFHFGAFSKQFFGWVTPTVVTGEAQITLAPVQLKPEVIKLYPNGDPNSLEYFLLENRQAVGFDQDWPSKGLCPGLLIWHIDDRIVKNPATFLVMNSPSMFWDDTPKRSGVVIVEADGRYDMINEFVWGECSDTWQVGRTWNATSTPNSNLWDEIPSNLCVSVLSQAGDGSLTLSIGTDECGGGGFRSYLPIVINP